MINKFQIELRSPMGLKKGNIMLNVLNEAVEATLECLGNRHILSGTLDKSGKLLCKGILKTPIGEEPFEIEANIAGNHFDGLFRRKNQSYEICGDKLDG